MKGERERSYLSAFRSVFCLIHPVMKNLCLPPLWDFQKLCPPGHPTTMDGIHSNHGRKETFPSLASCWLFTKKGGLIQGKWQCDTLAPSDCSISPIPRQTAIPASEKKNKSQDSIYPLKRQRPKDNWTVIQMPCLHCL